jgi:hypothetical protein
MEALNPKLAEARRLGRISFSIPDGIISPSWRHNDAQIVGVAHLLLQPRMILADPPGCGKSPMASIAYGIIRKRMGWRGLVLTPTSNLSPWKEKAELFVPDLKVAVYHGTHRADVLDEDHDLLVTTYMTAAKDMNLLARWFKGCPPVAILDEAHALRGWKQEFMRPRLQALTRSSKYVWLTTATPDGGRYRDLASLVDFILPTLIGGENEFEKHFTRRVLIKLPKSEKNQKARSFYRKATKPHHFRNITQFLKRVSPFVLRRPVEAFGEAIPPVVWEQKQIPMTEPHTRLYTQVLHKILPATEDREERLLTDIAAHTYAQLVSDAPPVLGFDVVPAKVLTLIDLLKGELQDEHVVIYAKYAQVATWLFDVLRGRLRETPGGTDPTWKHLLKVTKGGLPGISGLITGGQTRTERDKARLRFMGSQDRQLLPDGAPRLIVTNAGAESLDLQKARAVILYDLPWTTLELEQVVGRARRIGTPHASILVYALAQNNLSDSADSQRLRMRSAITKNINNTLTSTSTSTSTTNSIEDISTIGSNNAVVSAVIEDDDLFKTLPSLTHIREGISDLSCNGEKNETLDPCTPNYLDQKTAKTEIGV